jgi:hypothetical protein
MKEKQQKEKNKKHFLSKIWDKIRNDEKSKNRNSIQ